MRQALRQNPAKRQTAIARSVPAPTGGWDTESPLAAMPPKNAIILDNFIPRAAYVEIRRGFAQQVSGFAAPVESLIAWRGSSSGDKLFAASAGEIYDVTTAGSLGSAVYGSASSARWKSTNFANDAGRFAVAVNGQDTPIKYDGSAFSTTAITGSSGSITLDPTTLADVMAHHQRLFFLEKDSLRVWYLPVFAIAGAASLLDIGAYFTSGGRIVAEGTWSLDTGSGMDDIAVFVTSEGQVAAYQGTDPSDINNWGLIGVFDIAKPIGERCLIKYGGDLVILTEDGLIPLSAALSSKREDQKTRSLTGKIATAFSTAATNYRSNFGWQAILYPGAAALAIVNVPTAELSVAQQYVQSIQTGAWCRFTGLNAICWEVANGAIYFGGQVGVFQWDTGASDDGETIVADVKPAFNAFGSDLVEKHFTMIRALIKAPSIIKPALEVNTDYKERVPTAQQTVVDPGDIGPDDANAIRYDWTGASGSGYVGAPRMRIAIIGTTDSDTIAVNEAGTDVLVTETGGSEEVLIRADLPLEVPVQLIGFDLMFQAGGQI